MRATLALTTLIAATAAPTLARAEPASSAVVENSLTVFPTTIDVEVRRDEVVDRTIGIVQTGAERREVSFEISGDAAPYVSIHGVASGSEIDRIEAEDGVPTFVVMRFAPVGPLPDGQLTAGVEIVAQGAEVAIGSMIGVELDVGGDHVVRARVLEVATAGSVEIGRPFRLTATLDVEGTVVLEPEISLVLTSATATEELRAHPPPVEPGTGRAVQASWFTGSWTPGRYDGEVVFGAQGVEIGRAPVSIEVVPAGTAPRAVEVLSAEVIETSRPGGIAKVAIQVRNVGAFEGRAVFVGDLWRATAQRPARHRAGRHRRADRLCPHQRGRGSPGARPSQPRRRRQLGIRDRVRRRRVCRAGVVVPDRDRRRDVRRRGDRVAPPPRPDLMCGRHRPSV